MSTRKDFIEYLRKVLMFKINPTILTAMGEEPMPNWQIDGAKMIKMINLLLILTLVIFILLMITGWTYYFIALKFWKKKSFWMYTGIGPIIMYQKLKQIPEPGRTYIKISLYILGISPILFVISLLLIKIFGLI